MLGVLVAVAIVAGFVALVCREVNAYVEEGPIGPRPVERRRCSICGDRLESSVDRCPTCGTSC